MTRLALSTSDLWASIFSTNKLAVLAALDAFVDSLKEARNAIETDQLSYVFNTASQFAASIRNPSLRE
jgi:prephenate dehydrogenase